MRILYVNFALIFNFYCCSNLFAQSIEYEELSQISNSSIMKIDIDTDDIIYASTKSYLYKSIDDGASWIEYFGSEHAEISSWSITDDGNITIGTIDARQDSINNAFLILKDGTIDDWGISAYAPSVFSINDGEHRIVLSVSGCPGDVGLPGYFSNDNQDFKEENLLPFMCFPNYMDAVFYKDIIYLSGRPNFGDLLFYTIDMMTNWVFREDGLTPSGNNLGYYSLIKSNGEILAYPMSFSDIPEDDQRFPVYYSPDVAEIGIEPVGRAPRGQLFQTDTNDRAIIIQNDGDHYVRPISYVDYDEIEVINKSFDSFIDGAFDSQNRLVIAVDGGRILRAVTDGVITSVADEKAFAFSVSPNPVADVLHVVFDKSKPYTCTISNVTGVMIQQSKHLDRAIDLDINELESGIYFLSVEDSEGRRVTRKFIKM